MATSMTEQDEAAIEHKSYVPDYVRMPEFTWSALLLGTLLGLVFAASSLYLVLKVGMTVSASIPVAVLAITVFRAISKAFRLRRATILENNVVQTAGSAGESIAFGVGVTMPALLLLGFSMDLPRVMVVAVLGGLLGILAMIPLRRAFIVKLHGRPGQPGTLLFPEGTACAQVLISGEKGGTTGKTVFIGFGLAFLHKFLTEGMNVLVGTFKWPIKYVNRSAVIANEFASELLGVGYIIGARTSAIMMSGAILGYLVIIPLISYVGDYVDDKVVPPGGKLVSEMTTREIRDNYLLFIGAGCVATAGIISMFRTLPMIVRSIQSGLRSVTVVSADSGDGKAVRRTENDMSMKTVLLGSLGLIVLLTIFLTAQVGIVTRPGWCHSCGSFRLPVRNGLLTTDRRDWLVVEPNFGHDRCDSDFDLLDIPYPRLGIVQHARAGVVHCSSGLCGIVKWRDHCSVAQNGFPGWRHATLQPMGHPHRRPRERCGYRRYITGFQHCWHCLQPGARESPYDRPDTRGTRDAAGGGDVQGRDISRLGHPS